MSYIFTQSGRGYSTAGFAGLAIASHQSLSIRDVRDTESQFARSRRQLKTLSALRMNWDTYGARQISPEAIRTAELILSEIESVPWKYGETNAVPTSVLPVANGAIQLEWQNANDELQLQIRSSKALRYLIVQRDMEPKYLERDISMDAVHGLLNSFFRRVAGE